LGAGGFGWAGRIRRRRIWIVPGRDADGGAECPVELKKTVRESTRMNANLIQFFIRVNSRGFADDFSLYCSGLRLSYAIC